MVKTLLDKGKGIVTNIIVKVKGHIVGDSDFFGKVAKQYVRTPGVLFNKTDLFEQSIPQAALNEYLIRKKHRFIAMILDDIYYNRNGHYSLENKCLTFLPKGSLLENIPTID